MPFYQDEKVKLYQADVLEWALAYKQKIDDGKALPFHSICADPPYGLGELPPIADLLNAWLNEEEYNTGVGFMSAHWDVVPGPKYWRALWDIVFPGGYMFLFSGTRTADLLGISCRLGGWEPFDRVTNFVWAYGSGFPKSHNISKSLDSSEIVACPDCKIELDGLSEQEIRDWADYENIAFTEALADMVETRREDCETCEGSGQVRGAEREVVGQNQWSGRQPNKRNNTRSLYGDFNADEHSATEITAPATPLAQAFDGYGSALKPSGEPILLFRRPREGRTFAELVREFGSGALNVGACRVATTPDDATAMERCNSPGSGRFGDEPRGHLYGSGKGFTPQNTSLDTTKGRWPPNVHFSHVSPHSRCSTCSGDGDISLTPPTPMSLCPACMPDEGGWWIPDAPDECPDCGTTTTERMQHENLAPCPECYGVGMVGGCRRVGSKRVRGTPNKPTKRTSDKFSGRYNAGKPGHYRLDNEMGGGHADPDGFEQVDDWVCVENCPVRLLDEMAGERKTGMRQTNERKGGWANNSKLAHGGGYQDSTASAARFYPNHDWSLEIAERLEGETPFRYVAKASRGEREAGCQERPRKFLATMGDGIGAREHNEDEPSAWVGNSHPTVKPLSLCKWLATLCMPPAHVKPRLCVPYAGSGSEVIGAILAGGWAEIHGIERELEYVAIAAARIAWWSKWAKLTGKSDPARIRKLGAMADARTAPQGDERQTSMFDVIE